jgi:hypothetical protein
MRADVSLPVVWTQDGTHVLPGSLELEGTTLRLTGGSREREERRELDLADIASTHLARSVSERVGGRMTLVIELRAGGWIRVAGFEQPGSLIELADRLHEASR